MARLSLAMSLRGILWGLLWLFRAGAQDGEQDFQPSFIHMSGTMVTASLTNSQADTFSLAVADNETGLLPLSDCSGRNRTDDWSLQVTHHGNVSRVTVSLTRHLQLCISNLTDCCVEALCLLQSLQVSACQGAKVMARLLIQAEIYPNTTSGNLTGKIENATVIPNQVFHPLGSCPCNLTAGVCDIQCCCDQDCTPEMKQLFESSCFEGVFGGDVNPPFDQLCSVKSRNLAPDWFPFLCVQSSVNNSPFLGYFYDGSTSSSQASSFKLLVQAIPGKLSNGYRQGDPILTVHNDYFTVPQLFIAGQCARNAPVSFLRDVEAECVATCQEAGSAVFSSAVNSGVGDNIKPEVIYEERSSALLPCANKECRNVTFAEDYIIVWEGKRIKELKIKVLYGGMCLEETITQKFTVTFVSANATSLEEFSGNPGYQLGKPVRATNLTSLAPVTTLKLWKPVGENLCSSANLTPLLFGFNSISGCLMEVSLADNCTQLREDVAARLNSLVQASHVGKRGNAHKEISDDWVEVLRVNASSISNASDGSLRGICPDVPAHLNIQIITADVGAIEGIPQEEILGVQIGFSTITWQVPCGLACPENVSSFPVSAAVQFIKVPAQPPVPKTRFQINYTEYDCRRNDVCWPELFYPMTRYYTGEPYSHTLAKGLVLAFFVLLAVVLSSPWSGILRLWNKP
ncbi:tectonic-2 [Protobothrops mucrosquamatus]|uniref:tectonic-2 n=1 Tax=Protobothrops mucrosquamatus TaxID=103944 RepID=UPI000775F7B3|nr:tectonic-2 [Protobothrops mucrosquamatus]